MVLRVLFHGTEEKLFRDYFDRLLITATGVFNPNGFRPEALSSLKLLQDEVVHTAGPRIKGNYLRRLGRATILALLIVALATVGLHVAILYAEASSYSWAEKIGVLLAASFIGMFFSASVRNQKLSFETLVTPPADIMHPWIRLVVYGIAVTILALILQKKIVTITFGEVFSTASIGDDFPTAVLVGLLLGVAEIALPEEVARWSGELLSRLRGEK
jgi:hypothetical protein